MFALKTIIWAGLRLFGLQTNWLRYRWKQYPRYLSDLDNIKFDEFFRQFEQSQPELSVDSGSFNDIRP